MPTGPAIDAAGSSPVYMQTPVRSLAPWLENEYFDLPVERSIVLGAASASVLIANPHRVAFLASASGGVSNIWITTAGTAINGKGLILTSGGLPLMLTQAIFGPLVQMAWQGIGGAASQTLTVIELILSEWPSGNIGATENEEIADSFRPCPSPDIAHDPWVKWSQNWIDFNSARLRELHAIE